MIREHRKQRQRNARRKYAERSSGPGVANDQRCLLEYVYLVDPRFDVHVLWRITEIMGSIFNPVVTRILTSSPRSDETIDRRSSLKLSTPVATVPKVR